MTIPSGAEQLKRQFEAYAIGRFEALRVNLQFFLEEMSSIPESMAPTQFEPLASAAEALLDNITSTLNRGAPLMGVTVIEGAPPHVTEEMVDAGVDAMVWEGSTVSDDEMPNVIRNVVEAALAAKNKPHL